jgi:hypothetical protein
VVTYFVLTPLTVSQKFLFEINDGDIPHERGEGRDFYRLKDKMIIYPTGDSAETLHVESLVRDGNCKILQLWFQRTFNSIK